MLNSGKEVVQNQRPSTGHAARTGALSRAALLALDALMQKPTRGIPIWLINPMEWRMIDRIAGEPEGTYERDPTATYRKMLIKSGCCMVDQWIPRNPLTMRASGYEAGTVRTATTGKQGLLLDGMEIGSPEDVVEHLESIIFPRTKARMSEFTSTKPASDLVGSERAAQETLAPEILKVPYGCVRFPHFRYGTYGYENYFMAYALYPEVMEMDFSLQADAAVLHNEAIAPAFGRASLPPLVRLDHDMADSRGTLVDIRSLDAIWFPHFARSLEPVRKAGIKMIWHCDGNLTSMVPRLLEAGLHGFQGFQYEDGMDYESICARTTRDGDPLIIIAGVSVTRTLPRGTPSDVRREMRWLVEHGPKTGLFLGASSSIVPGVPWENLEALIEGFLHYREIGRG